MLIVCVYLERRDSSNRHAEFIRWQMTKPLHAVPSENVVPCGVIRETKRGRCFHSAGGTEGLSEIDVNHSWHLPEGTAGSWDRRERTWPGVTLGQPRSTSLQGWGRKQDSSDLSDLKRQSITRICFQRIYCYFYSQRYYSNNMCKYTVKFQPNTDIILIMLFV